MSKNKKNTKKTNSKTEKKQRKVRPANDAFRVPDPKAMLKANPEDTLLTLQTIAADKQLKKSELHTLHGRLAYRLALIGLVACNTLARNAADRVYKATSKTNARALKAALAN